jgi:hypothetical protein
MAIRERNNNNEMLNYDETGGGGNIGNNNIGSGRDAIDDGYSGGGGSGGGTGGGLDNTNINTYVFTITANLEGFTTTVNGDVQPTPQSVRITKDSLINKPKKIEVKKKGHTTQECYIISMIDDDTPIIDNGSNKLGLNQKVVQLQKYNGDIMVGPPLPLLGGTGRLIFTLNQAIISDEPVLHKIQFNISGKGSPVSILKNGTKNAEFFPTVGETNYRDISGTTYKIRSSDSKLFRITDMVITKAGASFKELKAEPNESLEALITLNATYIVSITTEKIEPVQPALNPIISLVKDEERRYNMNTKAGVPLLIQRNSDVKAITLIIGDDVMEFDELGDDNIIGITIPETSFKKIGKYEVKLFPFSFEDYENSIRESVEEVKEEEIKITPKKEKKKVIKQEKIVIPEEKIEDVVNPYNQTTGLGGGILPPDMPGGRPNNEVRTNNNIDRNYR